MEITDKAVRIFRALGDSTRWKIVQVIKDEAKSVTTIAAATELSQSAISHQLQTLKLYNVVKCQKKGKEVYYSLIDDHIGNMVELMIEHISHE